MVNGNDIHTHRLLTVKLQTTPSICTSHMIFIVDQSGSMRKSDVDNFATRSDAAFGAIATEYIGEQIETQISSNTQFTDVVTIIEMRDNSYILIEREPVTNFLFNKVLKLKNKARPKSHGVFMAALN